MRHIIIREKDKTYSLHCLLEEGKWPFDPPIYPVVMICPLCKQIRLNIVPAENGKWIIKEEN